MQPSLNAVGIPVLQGGEDVNNFVTYYATPPSAVSRNSGVAVVYGAWPARVLKHPGWTKKREICRRVATDDEDQWLATCMRHEAFIYPTLDGLLADESQFRSKESLDIFLRNVKRYFPQCAKPNAGSARESRL